MSTHRTWRWAPLALALFTTALVLALPALAQDLPTAAPHGAEVAGAALDASGAESGSGSAFWRAFGLILLLGMGFTTWFVLRRASTTLLYLGGFALVFAGERLWPDGSAHWFFTGLGLVGLAATIGLRLRAIGTATDPARQRTERQALVWSVVGIGSLLPYLLTTDGVVDGLGFDEDAAARWVGSWTALVPIAWLVGTIPMIFLDRLLVLHPVMVPQRAGKLAVEAGVSTALALCLVFPLNYLASQHEFKVDAAYFKTSQAGTSTLALARTLSEPVTAYLFFPAANDVKEEVLPYFRQLESASGGMLTVTVVDQALVPELAEDLQIRKNGYVALVQGETSKKFEVGEDIDRARSKLKKLDETVQKNLIALARGTRTVYILTGHGEASAKERDEPMRKLNLYKTVLDSQSYKLENLGVTEGSAVAVPDDAAAVIVAAPQKPLMPEEEAVLKAYLDRGGRVLLLVEHDGDKLDGLLGHLGLKAGDAPLAHAEAHISTGRGISDRVLIGTNRFGSHDAITTLSKNSTSLQLITPTATWIEKSGGTSHKITTLARSLADTWPDRTGDRQKGDDEEAKVWDLAVAVEGGEGDQAFRAVVVGDVSMFSDGVLQYSQGNAWFALDSMRWLIGDEDVAGETESEEDVRIQHTRDQDVVWFWGTIFAFPALILVGGVVFIRMRRSR